MEGSSETSPLGEPIIPNFVPTLSAVESVNSVQNQDFSDATSFAEINSPMLLIDDASTPKKKQACSQYKKIREVSYDTTSMTAKCSCKLFESNGIVCRHIIRVLRGAKINELPRLYVL